jgi:hypothetical protein
MRSLIERRPNRSGRRLWVGFMSGLILAASTAVGAASSVQPLMTIAVTNNSSFEIRHMYLSPVDRDAWGEDQMDGSPLGTGQTFTITDVACTGAELKVIAEDKDGCFFYGVVSCAESSAGWKITNDLPRDCGGTE